MKYYFRIHENELSSEFEGRINDFLQANDENITSAIITEASALFQVMDEEPIEAPIRKINTITVQGFR